MVYMNTAGDGHACSIIMIMIRANLDLGVFSFLGVICTSDIIVHLMLTL